MGRQAHGTEGSFFIIPASGTVFETQARPCYPRRESYRDTVSVVFQVAGPVAQSRETNYVGRGQLLVPNPQKLGLGPCAKTQP